MVVDKKYVLLSNVCFGRCVLVIGYIDLEKRIEKRSYYYIRILGHKII